MSTDEIPKIRGLRWEVTVSSSVVYYKGRGDTPNAALADLESSLGVGLKDAEEQVAAQQRRLDAIRAALGI